MLLFCPMYTDVKHWRPQNRNHCVNYEQELLRLNLFSGADITPFKTHFNSKDHSQAYTKCVLGLGAGEFGCVVNECRCLITQLCRCTKADVNTVLISHVASRRERATALKARRALPCGVSEVVGP